MTIPFSTAAATYRGQGAGRVLGAPRGLSTFWLGKPGAMVQLPGPDLGYDAPPSRATTSVTLLSGATATVRRRRSYRRWQFNWSRLFGRDWQVVRAFDEGVYSAGPFCFLPPEDVNRLPRETSTCGVPDGDVTGWAATVGTVAADASVASPVEPCGVLRWVGAGAGSQLVAGAVDAGAPVVDPASAVPYVPAEPVSASVRIRAAAATADLAVVAAGFDAGGALVSSAIAHSAVATADEWTELSVSAAPGALGAAVYVGLLIECSTGAAPDLLISTPQLELCDEATDWSLGAGAPRVVIPQDLTRSITETFASTVQLVLAQSS